jgi:hypothetical protein
LASYYQGASALSPSDRLHGNAQHGLPGHAGQAMIMLQQKYHFSSKIVACTIYVHFQMTKKLDKWQLVT